MRMFTSIATPYTSAIPYSQGIVEELAVSSAPPSLEERRREEILCRFPITGAAETEAVDRVGVTFEQLTEAAGVAPYRPAPQLSVGRDRCRPFVIHRREFLASTSSSPRAEAGSLRRCHPVDGFLDDGP